MFPWICCVSECRQDASLRSRLEAAQGRFITRKAPFGIFGQLQAMRTQAQEMLAKYGCGTNVRKATALSRSGW